MAQKEQTETIEYSDEKQKLLIDIMLSSEEVFSRCQNILSANYFSNKLRPAVKFIVKYADEKRVLPKIEHENAETGGGFVKSEDIAMQHEDNFLKEIATDQTGT